MTMPISKTIPADNRQLIAQIKNLYFWRGVSCAIILKPATVPSSFMPALTRRVTLPLRGGSRVLPGNRPFFFFSRAVSGLPPTPICVTGMCLSVDPADLYDPAKGRQHKGQNRLCESSQNLALRPFWALASRRAFRRISSARGSARPSAPVPRSFSTPTRWSGRRLALPPVRYATTLPTCADRRGGASVAPPAGLLDRRSDPVRRADRSLAGGHAGRASQGGPASVPNPISRMFGTCCPPSCRQGDMSALGSKSDTRTSRQRALRCGLALQGGLS